VLEAETLVEGGIALAGRFEVGGELLAVAALQAPIGILQLSGGNSNDAPALPSAIHTLPAGSTTCRSSNWKNRSSRRCRRCRFGISQLSTGSFSNAAARTPLSGPASDGVAVRGELSVLGTGWRPGMAARFR
jgi:hypothetical protein